MTTPKCWQWQNISWLPCQLWCKPVVFTQFPLSAMIGVPKLVAVCGEKKVVWRHLDCPLRWNKVRCRYVWCHLSTGPNFCCSWEKNTDKPPTSSLTLYVLGKAISVKYFWVGSCYWRSRISVISLKELFPLGEAASYLWRDSGSQQWCFHSISYILMIWQMHQLLSAGCGETTHLWCCPA